MTEYVNETNLAEYEAFVESHPKGHFAQSVLWAKQKPAWEWKAIVCRDEAGKIKGSIAFLIRKMPVVRKKMMYACRGPVCDLDDRATFGELMAAVLSCSWSYKLIGDFMEKFPGATEQEFYGEWVNMYISDGYRSSNQLMIDMVDRLTEGYTEQQIQNLEHIVYVCSQYEYMFWDMAWNEKMVEV